MSPPRASIIVPTHDHASTLAFAVGTALTQTIPDVEVLIVGDGVTDEVRRVARGLEVDERVRFFDHPKGTHHGEEYRDTAIQAARSDAKLLEDHTFVQSRNGYFTAVGMIVPYPGDLADARAIAAAMGGEPPYNFVSITGTAHSRRFYLEGGEKWTPAPPGIWPDLFQWRKMWSQPAFTGATSDRMTALQFPTSMDGRDRWSPKHRLLELSHWAQVASSEGGQDTINRLVARGDMKQMVDS